MAMVQPRNLHHRVWAAHAAIWLFLLVTLCPLVILVLASLQSSDATTDSLIFQHFSLEHWYLALGIPWEHADGSITPSPFPVLVWLWNSVKVAIVSATVIVIFATTGAYAFARLHFPGRRELLAIVTILPMFPPVLALTGIYSLFDQLGYYIVWLGLDSLWSLALAHLGGVILPFLLLMGCLATIDNTPEETAIIAGATPWQVLRYILLPSFAPTLVSAFVLAFLTSMGEFPVASVLLQSIDRLTLPVGLKQHYLQPGHFLWQDFAAAALLFGLPVTVVYLIGQRWLVVGQRVFSVRN